MEEFRNLVNNDQNLSLLCEITKYLDKCGYFNILQKQAIKFKIILAEGKTFQPFRSLVYIDFIDLLDNAVLLSQMLLKEPSFISKMVQNVVYIALTTYLGEFHNIQRGQVHAVLRIRGIRPEWNPKYKGLYSVCGVLSVLGSRTKYVRQSAWKCSEECENSFIILSGIPSRAPRCNSCNTTMEDLQKAGDCGEMVLATLINRESLQFASNDQRILATPSNIWLMDELADNLQLGCAYVMSVITSHCKQFAWYVECLVPKRPIKVHYFKKNDNVLKNQIERNNRLATAKISTRILNDDESINNISDIAGNFNKEDGCTNNTSQPQIASMKNRKSLLSDCGENQVVFSQDTENSVFEDIENQPFYKSQNKQKQKKKRRVYKNNIENMEWMAHNNSRMNNQESNQMNKKELGHVAGPWDLLFKMCWSTTEASMPVGKHLLLTMGVLLSLASIQEEENSVPISILALGSDSSSTIHIMDIASQLAQRVTFAGVGALLGVEERKELGVQAGALVLARYGVCRIGNWSSHAMCSKNIYTLTSESGVIKLENGEHLPMKCSIWTHWDMKKTTKEKTQLSILEKLFGITFQADDLDPEYFGRFLLEQAVNLDFKDIPKNVSLLSLKEMREIFKSITKWPVRMATNSGQTLKNYFISIRKDRPECAALQSLQILHNLAMAHARLNRRQEVIPEDVVLAIMLHQHSLLALHGDTLGLCPPNLEDIRSLERVNVAMRDFQNCLEEYVESLM